MQLLKSALLFSLVTLAFCSDAKADCPPWRPCGPGNTWGGNRLVKQGFFGADFRPACANHDACLQTGACRRDCDQQFLNDMRAACECSSNPKACDRKAKHYYHMARLFGGLLR
ncbi:MAG: hypothetical protein JWM11_2994 [Planctomycetaceae bacterium]|nr:hypothetical protein [Planctomycetaceae bacterium]